MTDDKLLTGILAFIFGYGVVGGLLLFVVILIATA